jgi:NAD(P)H-dependent flavin oxidoreductase YrpB (nitropropane dioxygenase family)
MTLSTVFTRLFSIEHPIALAPIGGSAGGALAAAVSNGGGLGLVGGQPLTHLGKGVGCPGPPGIFNAVLDYMESCDA